MLVEGDAVFVKPGQPRCSTQWPVGTVTSVKSNTSVEVDGMPRHVADCRRVPLMASMEDDVEEDEEEYDAETEQKSSDMNEEQPPRVSPRRSERESKAPDRLLYYD